MDESNDGAESYERSPTEYEALKLFPTTTGENEPSGSGQRRTTTTPMELLSRLFPTQKRSVLQLIYKGCNNDLVKTIECVLPSHEKAMTSLKCQAFPMGMPRYQQFPAPITTFPPFLPVPPNQHHQRFYLPASIASDNSPLYNMHSGPTYKRGYLPSIGFQNKFSGRELVEPAQIHEAQIRTCPRCQKDVAVTMRACDSCGHCFEAAPSPRG